MDHRLDRHDLRKLLSLLSVRLLTDGVTRFKRLLRTDVRREGPASGGTVGSEEIALGLDEFAGGVSSSASLFLAIFRGASGWRCCLEELWPIIVSCAEVKGLLRLEGNSANAMRVQGETENRYSDCGESKDWMGFAREQDVGHGLVVCGKSLD